MKLATEIVRNCRIKNLGDFEGDGGRHVSVESRNFKSKGERNDHLLHYEQVFGNVFERKGSKYCGALVKHLRKVKGEQMITLQVKVKHRGKSSN